MKRPVTIIIEKYLIIYPDGTFRVSGTGIAYMKDHHICMTQVERAYEDYKKEITKRYETEKKTTL